MVSGELVELSDHIWYISKGESKTGVLVLHDYWGIKDQLTNGVEQLGLENRTVMMPDLFSLEEDLVSNVKVHTRDIGRDCAEQHEESELGELRKDHRKWNQVHEKEPKVRGNYTDGLVDGRGSQLEDLVTGRCSRGDPALRHSQSRQPQNRKNQSTSSGYLWQGGQN